MFLNRSVVKHFFRHGASEVYQGTEEVYSNIGRDSLFEYHAVLVGITDLPDLDSLVLTSEYIIGDKELSKSSRLGFSHRSQIKDVAVIEGQLLSEPMPGRESRQPTGHTPEHNQYGCRNCQREPPPLAWVLVAKPLLHELRLRIDFREGPHEIRYEYGGETDKVRQR